MDSEVYSIKGLFFKSENSASPPPFFYEDNGEGIREMYFF